MAKCYAEVLGDCSGAIEDEHFISRSLQVMLGSVTVAGFAWQAGSSKAMAPGSYGHGYVVCAKHHDDLDGLDGNARDYFRNLMLVAGQNHLSTGVRGRASDIAANLDGRGLEKWFMKLICGAISAKSIPGVSVIPPAWVQGLFGKSPWPKEWAMYVTPGTFTTRPEDARFQLDFHWTKAGELNGIVSRAFAVETLFAITPPDNLAAETLRRPPGLGFAVTRPDGSDVLDGVPAGTHVQFRFTWPAE